MITRRTTRSSSSNDATSTSEVEPTKPPTDPQPLTLNDLVFGGTEEEEEGGSISLKDMQSEFPARGNQIQDMMNLLGPVNSPMLPLFVYGGSSTGKTSVVLRVFKYLKRAFVYVSCRTCYSQRILFESVLNQSLLHRKSSGNGYSSAKRCDKLSDFVNFLRDALVVLVGRLKGERCEVGDGHMVYLIFDNLEAVREWDKSSSVLAFLFNLYDILRMPDVGIIFISNVSPDAYYSTMGYTDPVPLYFPEYTEADLHQILLRSQANRKLYASFLDVVLRPFVRVTRRLDVLSITFSSLFKIYCEPLTDSGAPLNEEMKRRLFCHFQPHLASSLNETFTVLSWTSPEGESKTRKGGVRQSEQNECFAEVDFHVSSSAKYLLISAFLASRNPATLDASLFDSTSGSDSRKRKRKASEKSMELKEITEQELLMKGPGTFPLERLLAIYQCITSVAEDSLNEEPGNDDIGTGPESGLMSDVLLQLSSLCSANFIIRGGSCPLEGSARYRSTISEDLALKVARSLKFPLPNYLYRR